MLTNSVQQRMSRIRPPRVNITYEIDIGNATEQKELPMVIGLILNLGESEKKTPQNALAKGFIPVKKNQIDQTMSVIQPSLNFSIPKASNKLNPSEIANIKMLFQCMQDFHPDAIVNQNTELKFLANKRKALAILRNRLIGQTSLQRQLNQWLKNH